jgi:hypothetical protein
MKNKKWLNQLLIFFILALLSLNSASAFDTAEQVTPYKAFSDCSGEIEKVVFQYSKHMGSNLIPTLHDFLIQAEEDTSIIIFCQDNEEYNYLNKLINKIWKLSKKKNIRIVNANKMISIWARDRYQAITSTALNSVEKKFIIPKMPLDEDEDRVNDSTLPESFIAIFGNDFTTSKSAVFFEGGDIASAENFIFAGYPSVMAQELTDYEETALILEREFGKKLIIVGSEETSVLDCHIDLFMTPIDDKRILLGCHQTGMEILENCPSTSDTSELITDLDQALPYIDALDLIGSSLESMGFEIIRIPLLFGMAADVEEEDNPLFVLTYNNLLLEESDKRKTAFVPRYNLPCLDKKAQNIYRNLGYKIKSVNVSGLYKYGGTLRCVSNVVSRRKNKSSMALPGKTKDRSLNKVFPEKTPSTVPILKNFYTKRKVKKT